MSISVTTVLDFLMEKELHEWYVNKGKAACKRIGDEAKRVGSAVDMLIQEDVKTGMYAVPANDLAIASSMRGWEAFKHENPTFVKSIVSLQEELRDGEIVGHPDILTDDTVWDIKTSKAIYPKYWIQTAQYARMSGRKYIGIIRLDKEHGICDAKHVKYLEFVAKQQENFDHFYGCYKYAIETREFFRQMAEMGVLGE